eukprot:62624-Rhodomonas_salina.1
MSGTDLAQAGETRAHEVEKKISPSRQASPAICYALDMPCPHMVCGLSYGVPSAQIAFGVLSADARAMACAPLRLRMDFPVGGDESAKKGGVDQPDPGISYRKTFLATCLRGDAMGAVRRS